LRTFVIADIHGCFKTLKHLIEKLHLKEDDELYFLGDYINKGPSSKEVIDFLIKLSFKYHVLFLRGNHEQLLLDAFKSPSKEADFLMRGGKETLTSFKVGKVNHVPKPYLDWIDRLPLYHQLSDFLLVHAGFNFGLPSIYDDKQAMLNIRSYTSDLIKTEGKLILHGHVPLPLAEIKSSLKRAHNGHISLDNGCAYPDKGDMGNLLALELNSMELIVQSNLDMVSSAKSPDQNL